MKSTMLKMTLALATAVAVAQAPWDPKAALELRVLQMGPLEAYAEAGPEVARREIPAVASSTMKKRGFPISSGSQRIVSEGGEIVWAQGFAMIGLLAENGHVTPKPTSPSEWKEIAGKALEQLGAWALAYPVLGVTELRIGEVGGEDKYKYGSPKGLFDIKSIYANSYRLPMSEFVRLTQEHPDRADLRVALANAMKPLPNKGLTAKPTPPKKPKK